MREILQKVTSSLVLAASSVAAGAHPAEIESRLAFIIGDWTVAGSDAVYSDNCQWFEDKAFVVCDTRDARKGVLHHSIAVLGYSTANQNYTYQQYDNGGGSRNETCFTNDQGGLTCLGQRRAGGQMIETRSYISPNTGGVGIRQEKSINAAPWAPVGQVQYVRRKPELPLPARTKG